jgi:serine/threonine-protein kinase
MADATDPYIGREIAGYRIEERIGRGGMGVVYRAEQLRLGRRVAFKIIAPELAQTAGFRERFEREARIAASLHHPSVVAVYDAGEADGLLWLAMQFIGGSDLASILAAESWLPADRALSVCGQIAAALDAAHAVGLVHRDVKPGNVLIDGTHAYLSDFGLTKVGAESGAMMTRAGDMVGSVHYCAPEQIEGRTVDGRTDMYALGGVLYHCLAGDVPYPRGSGVAVMYAQLNEPAPRLSLVRPDLPAGLDAVIARAMEKSPERRFATCTELIEAAAAVLRDAGPLNERPAPPRVVPAEGDDEDRGTIAGRIVPETGDASVVGTVVVPAVSAGVRQEAGAARVLLAGLDDAMKAVTQVALGEHVEVQEAEATDAVGAAREYRPDVVVLDWNASQGAGRELLRTLRADPVTRSTKVLLLVDWSRSDRGEVASAGADASLGMPFSSVQLQVQARKLLGRDALAG